MARKTETQKLQDYADEIWGVGKMEVVYEGPFKGFSIIPTDDFGTDDPMMYYRFIGQDASEAHAELDTMADLSKSARIRKLAQI